MQQIDGYKTYIVGAVMIAYGILVQGWQMGDWDAATQTILLGLGFLAGRSAIAKMEC